MEHLSNQQNQHKNLVDHIVQTQESKELLLYKFLEEE